MPPSNLPGARLDNPPQWESAAYEAALYFDDGDDPTAQIDTAGVYTTAQAARDAIAEAIPKSNAEAASLGYRGRWIGYVEKVKTEYEEWADLWVWSRGDDGPMSVVDGPFT